MFDERDKLRIKGVRYNGRLYTGGNRSTPKWIRLTPMTMVSYDTFSPDESHILIKTDKIVSLSQWLVKDRRTLEQRPVGTVVNLQDGNFFKVSEMIGVVLNMLNVKSDEIAFNEEESE